MHGDARSESLSSPINTPHQSIGVPAKKQEAAKRVRGEDEMPMWKRVFNHESHGRIWIRPLL
jgi:hypothetical protein